ncbi:hypothetical protein GCM10011390_06290 [Aureimonas endophytica]|uniref:Uncharacterized protein n=1 Tax=Aureimonas endophytica TaxID=2027858 RepID=A0A916ZEJ9_9HYPH|nr:hypothetical protein [Aureimonas endophytica]GGD90246.1 hypothetical protein GCM10011390_06290 [Aureimonas endophytica]
MFSKLILTSAVMLATATSAFGQADVVMSPNSRRPALLDEYTAFIGRDDLYSSNGERLTKAGQVLRQDRANFHLYGIRQRGDMSDSFFESKGNRPILEGMLAAGRMSREAASAIVAGGAFVRVQIWGYGNTGDYIRVEVE